MTTEVRRVRVWPGVIRVTHWAMMLSLLVLMPTGWLLTTGLIAGDELYELLRHRLHEPAGHLLAVALAVRLVYLVIGGNSVSGWRALVPSGPQLAAMREALRFYSALGSGRLPAYYAHNPFWAPLYLVLFLLLAVATATGLVLELPFVRSVAHVDEPAALALHGRLLEWVAAWCFFHVAAAVLHDWRGQGSDTSALISGYRIFPVNRDVAAGPSTTAIRIEDIGRPVPRAGRDETRSRG
jgi:Ni/Fe-hydrogenase 1 B-type cytochrome subunit